MSELEFKRWFRGQFRGWSEVYEPTRGSGVGFPDTQLLVGGVLVPVELKIGTVVDDRLFLDGGIEPAQVPWHHRFAEAGGVAWFVVGVWTKAGAGVEYWQPWRLPKPDLSWMMNWKDGWLLSECELWDIWEG